MNKVDCSPLRTVVNLIKEASELFNVFTILWKGIIEAIHIVLNNSPEKCPQTSMGHCPESPKLFWRELQLIRKTLVN